MLPMTQNIHDGIRIRIPAVGTKTHYRPAQDGLIAHMPLGLLQIEDNTGLTISAPSSFTDIKGTPMAAPFASTSTTSPPFTVSATTGLITANDNFVALVSMTLGLFTKVDSQVLELQVVQNSTALNRIYQKYTQAATGLFVSGSTSKGIVQLAKGDTIKAQVKASTGDFTVKGFSLSVLKIADLDPASLVLA